MLIYSIKKKSELNVNGEVIERRVNKGKTLC